MTTEKKETPRFAQDLLDKYDWLGTLMLLRDGLNLEDRRRQQLDLIICAIAIRANIDREIKNRGLLNILQALIDSHEQCLPEYNSRPCPSEEVLTGLQKLLLTSDF